MNKKLEVIEIKGTPDGGSILTLKMDIDNLKSFAEAGVLQALDKKANKILGDEDE